jgi:7,8-dihydroneopterin aldolase/epimerase/oxygenase
MIDEGIVEIIGLEIPCMVGVYDDEYLEPQVLIIDLTMHFILPEEFNDDLSNTLDYEQVANLCKKIASQQHFRLIETLAQAIVNSCLENFSLTRIKTLIKKPSAIKDAQYCSFCYEKQALQKV